MPVDKFSRRPGTYAPQEFITGENGRNLIPLTAGEARRLFNLHTRVTHPDEYHVRWSDWRRYRQAADRNRIRPESEITTRRCSR